MALGWWPPSMIGGPPGWCGSGADDEAVALVVAAVELDGGTRPRLAADLDQLVGAADALAAMAAEALELDVPVAEPEADHAATAGQHVEERAVLGHPDRIVQRRQGEAEADVMRLVAWTIAAAYGATDPTNRASWKWCSLTHTLSSPTCSAWTTWSIDSRSVSP